MNSKKSVYIKTFGCSANQAESEIMAGLLHESGKDVSIDEKDSKKADAMLINVCTVKGDKKVIKEILQLHKANPNGKIIVGGCATKEMIAKIEAVIPEFSVINTDNIKSIIDVVNTPSPVRILDRKKEIKVSLPRIRHNKFVAIVPICQGCTSFCTYCSTKLLKGNIFSYPIEKIIKEIDESVKDGCKEIWLTSQDNADYGFDWDKKSHLPQLLKEISKIKGDFKVRVGMMNPIGVMSVLDELIESFDSDKIFRFIHVPVQAASNVVLKKMARRYKVEDYKLMIGKFKKAFPDMTVATDIIVGFPEETDEQFNETLKLVEETRPDVINIARFVPREGTVAAALKDQIKEDKKKLRSTELTVLFRKISKEINQTWIGYKGKVIIDEIGKDGELMGRNYAYKPVVLQNLEGKNESLKIGDVVDVEIVDASQFVLKGKVI